MSRIDFNKPITTRDGKPVRIICMDKEDPCYSVVALVQLRAGKTEDIISYTTDGKYYEGSDHYMDLVNKVEKHVKWFNVYRSERGGIMLGCEHRTEEEAKYGNALKDPAYIKTISVEIEV